MENINKKSGKAVSQKIVPCLWFDKNAEEATNFYTSVFKNSKISDIVRNPEGSPAGKAGSVLTVSFNLDGQQFLALNGGPEFKFNPSVSFFVNCETELEIDDLFANLSGGKILMPLQKYPFSEKFGWVEDKYGISWQLNFATGKQKITPFFLFVGDKHGKAEEAINFYVSVFQNSKVEHIVRFGKNENEIEGEIKHGAFRLGQQQFMAMESSMGHQFAFNESISFIVNCETQQEVDYYWEKLLEGGGNEVECGWLKDKYGVSWQVVPVILPKLLQNKDSEKAKRAMMAMLKMKKLDIALLEQA